MTIMKRHIVNQQIYECPAELCVEQAQYGGWNWFICQPDRAWGVWESSPYTYADKELALKDATNALQTVLNQQGF